ncbi:unnamed protein product [Moneuplotes crassus]|uniref:HIT-type domain-containing protein n=1 Tax=Euplotes crassus TaxID=5936 RepID=A0AAD2D1W4_EUPCR|nr:unnamed protein product [Moneuplotes crassus]
MEKIEEGPAEILEPTDPAKLCMMCKEKEFKYKCPNCSSKTCSLICVKQHKKELKCAGIPKPSKFVSKETYNVNNLCKDITFIQNGLTIVNQSRKELSEANSMNRIDKKWKFLRYFCRKHRNIGLKLAPSVFMRHQNNKTYYSQNDKTIFWTLEFRIILKSGGKYEKPRIIRLSKCVNEKFLIKNILNDFCTDKTQYYEEHHLFMNDIKPKLEDPSKIQLYLERTKPEEFKHLITPKQPGNPDQVQVGEIPVRPVVAASLTPFGPSDVALTSVNKTLSLKEILDGTVVLEHPTLYMVI